MSCQFSSVIRKSTDTRIYCKYGESVWWNNNFAYLAIPVGVSLPITELAQTWCNQWELRYATAGPPCSISFLIPIEKRLTPAYPRLPKAMGSRRTFIAPTPPRRGQQPISANHVNLPKPLLLIILAADFVQDLYVKELRAFKPTPLKSNDSDGHVQQFSLPKARASPEESDIAKDLKSYDSQVVEVEGQEVVGGAASTEKDWFEDDEESEEAHAAHWKLCNRAMPLFPVLSHSFNIVIIMFLLDRASLIFPTFAQLGFLSSLCLIVWEVQFCLWHSLWVILT